MKKIFTLFATLISVATLQAQTFSFVDANTGAEIANGSTLTMEAVYDEDWEQMMANLEGVAIKNNGSAAAEASLKVTAIALPEGEIACCLGTSCRNVQEQGASITVKSNIAGGDVLTITNTEWVGFENYGTASATFEIVGGPSITVNFVYADATNLDTTKKEDQIVAYYSLLGDKLDKPTSGINIVRYANGRTCRKVIRK